MPRKFLFFLIVVFLFYNNLICQVPGDVKYKSITTRHFRIHFQQNLSFAAIQLSKISEEYYIVLTKSEKWRPLSKIDIVLVDSMDLTNGYSNPFPRNSITLFITRPLPGMSIDNYDEWLRFVFIHEFTHTLNMDQVNGFPSYLRASFGQICIPNALQPLFLLEGNAVLNESDLTGLGRLNSAYADMIMRTEFQNENAKKMPLATVIPYTWPNAEIPYLYGAYFNKYLQKKHSKSFNEIMEKNSNNCLPFLNSKNARDVYGYSFVQLWNEWQDYTYDFFDNQRKTISNAGLTNYTQITNIGYNSSLPTFSNDGSSILFFNNDGKSGGYIYSMDLNTKKLKKINRVAYPLSLCADNNEILYTDIDIYKNKYIFYDLYSKKEKSSLKKRLTKMKRILFFDKKNSTTAEITIDMDLYSLKIKNSSKEITISNTDKQLAFCKISNDEKKVLFYYRDKKAASGLAFVDIETGKITRLIEDYFQKLYPSWAPDNKNILFSYDKTGVYNIYDLSLETGEIKQISNVLTGMFYPEYSHDKSKVLCTTYDKNGYDVSIFDSPKKSFSAQNVEFKEIGKEYFKFIPDNEIIESENTIENYNGLYTLLPSLWLPFILTEQYGDTNYNTFGAGTLGTDVLEFHYYEAFAMFNPNLYHASVNLRYNYQRYRIQFGINYSNDNLFLNGDPQWEYPKEDIVETINSEIYLGSISIPFIKAFNSNIFSIYGLYQKETTHTLYPNEEYESSSETESYAAISYYFSNSKIYPYSITSEHGIDFSSTMLYSNEAISSNENSIITLSSLNINLPFFFKNHVLDLNFTYGGIFGEDTNSVFTLSEEMSNINSPLSIKSFGIRGYENSEDEAKNFGETKISYYLPLTRKEHGLNTSPLLIRKVFLVPFYNAGNVFDHYNDLTIRHSLGSELHIEMDTGYWFNLDLYAGYTRGLNSDGNDYYYFGITGFIEARTNSKKRYLVK